jgi:regulatory protein
MGSSRMKSPRGTGRSLMSRAVGLLSRREHSRFELGRKLQRYLAPEESVADIERVLDQLAEEKLLSDPRFAASLVRQRSSRYGDLRLVRDLRDRGVAPVDADAAMKQVAGSEAQRALAAWSRRFDALPTSADERGRQGRFLQARGFSMDAIKRVLAGKVDADE